MKTFTTEELAEIIIKHHSWLNNEEGGERADLSYANLRYAKSIRGAVGNMSEVKSIQCDYWSVTYTA